MKHAVVTLNGRAVIPSAQIADSFFTRFAGLMFRKSIPEDYGLIISPCNQIHMFNMRFAIDVIYLTREGEVVHIDRGIKPWRVGKTVRQAFFVIEVPEGACEKQGIAEGCRLEITGEEQK